MRKVALAALSATTLCGSANAVNTLTFSFATPTQNITTAGGKLSFVGTVSAPITNSGSVFINGDGFSADTPLSVSDDPFFFGFPLSLAAGQSYTGLALNVSVPALTATGTYTGSFYIAGGDNDTADIVLSSTAFAVRVTTATVPEPYSWAMMIVGFGAIGAALRRRKVQVSFA